MTLHTFFAIFYIHSSNSLVHLFFFCGIGQMSHHWKVHISFNSRAYI